MRISAFEIITIEIPMRMSVEHALAKRATARNVLVRAHCEGDAHLTGWGESCPREYVTGESVESAVRDLANSLLPRLVGTELADLPAAEAVLTEMLSDVSRSGQAAFCAAELAVLDLVGRATETSAGKVFGPEQAERARYSGVLATEDPMKVREYCALMKKFGVAEVKVKVTESLDGNREILEIAREILGSEVALRLDANAAWDADESIRQLEALREFELGGVEQPVPAEDLEALMRITAAELCPVVVDESLCSLADAHELIEKRACDVFNVRISKCGGLINAGRIERAAAEAGLALSARRPGRGDRHPLGRGAALRYASRAAVVRGLVRLAAARRRHHGSRSGARSRRLRAGADHAGVGHERAPRPRRRAHHRLADRLLNTPLITQVEPCP